MDISKELKLTDSRDVLVNRKDTVTNTTKKKIIEDNIQLDRCIKNKDKIPRTLPKGGKKEVEKILKSPDATIPTFIGTIGRFSTLQKH